MELSVYTHEPPTQRGEDRGDQTIDVATDLIVEVRPMVSLEEARLMTSAAWKLSPGIGDATDRPSLGRDHVESLLVAMTTDAVWGVDARA